MPFRLWMKFKYRGMSASPVLMDVCVWDLGQWAGCITDSTDWGKSCSAAEGGFCKPELTVPSSP